MGNQTKLEDIQKAALLILWYKQGDWHTAQEVSSFINMDIKSYYQVARSLKELELIDTKLVPGEGKGRWKTRPTVTAYRLTDKGKEEAKKLIRVIEGKNRPQSFE